MWRRQFPEEGTWGELSQSWQGETAEFNTLYSRHFPECFACVREALSGGGESEEAADSRVPTVLIL